jgi:putative transposase
MSFVCSRFPLPNDDRSDCDGISRTRVARNGIVPVRQTRVGRTFAGQTVYPLGTEDHLLVFDDQGTEIMKHSWPRPGVKYDNSGKPREGRPK